MDYDFAYSWECQSIPIDELIFFRAVGIPPTSFCLSGWTQRRSFLLGFIQWGHLYVQCFSGCVYMLTEARIPHSTCYQLAHHWMVKFAWGIPAKFRSKSWSQDFCQSNDQFGMLTSKLGLTGKLGMMCFFPTAMWVPGSKSITWPKNTADSAVFEVFINQIIGDLSHCDVIDWCFATGTQSENVGLKNQYSAIIHGHYVYIYI